MHENRKLRLQILHHEHPTIKAIFFLRTIEDGDVLTMIRFSKRVRKLKI